MNYVVYLHTEILPLFPPAGQQYGLLICHLRSLSAHPLQTADFTYTDSQGTQVSIKVVWQYAITYTVDVNRRCVRVIGLERAAA